MKVCPICKKEYSGYPALSRMDNKSEICPLCGIREALDASGVKDTALISEIVKISEEETERILNERKNRSIAVET